MSSLQEKHSPQNQLLKCGMVDELAPAEYIVDVAARMIGRGKPHRSGRALVNNKLVASVIASRARSQVMKKTRGHYPAVTKALEVVTRGISMLIPESLALERDGILELVQTGACHNLIRIFLLQERAKNWPCQAWLPHRPPRPLREPRSSAPA